MAENNNAILDLEDIVIVDTEQKEPPEPNAQETEQFHADRRDWFTWKFFNRHLPPEKRRYEDSQTPGKVEDMEFLYFSQLPLELWTVVLSYFGSSLKLYRTLCQVCKAFRQIMELNHFWKERYFSMWNLGLLFGTINPVYNWKQIFQQEYKNDVNKGCFALKVNQDGMRIIGSKTQIDFLGMTANIGMKSGKWVYELEMVKSCLTQNGFICTKFETGNEACGVGDDWFSWSYDPLRNYTFFGAKDTAFATGCRWKEGDVTAYGIDLEEKKMECFINGKSLGIAFTNMEVPVGDTVFASVSISFQGEFIVNLGQHGLKYSYPGYTPIYCDELEHFWKQNNMSPDIQICALIPVNSEEDAIRFYMDGKRGKIVG